MKLTETQWQIMNALWQQSPATAREIADRLPKNIDWAYTTVKTMLSRLVEKKAVAETKKGNLGVYEPLLTRKNAQRTAIKSMVNQAFDGAFGPMMHFLLEDKKMSAGQKSQLLQVLKQQQPQKKGGKK